MKPTTQHQQWQAQKTVETKKTDSENFYQANEQVKDDFLDKFLFFSHVTATTFVEATITSHLKKYK